jgi:hypothetical protein
MDSSIVLGKTRRGVDELAQRTAALPQKLRSVLILVDGKTAYSELVRKLSFMPQCGEHLVWLLQQGFVQAMSPLPVAVADMAAAPDTAAASTVPALHPPSARSARNALLALAHELLGPHAGAVVQRLQDTEDTREALTSTLERCHKLIRLSIDEKKAEQFRRLGAALLMPTD